MRYPSAKNLSASATPRRANRATWIISLAWMVVVLIGSFLPVQAKISIGTAGSAHDAVHVVVFAVTTCVLVLWANNRTEEFVLGLLAFVLGVSLELAQMVITGDGMEWVDVQTDGLGILLALLCMQFRGVRAAVERLTQWSAASR